MTQVFDFKKNSVEQMSLEVLKSTYLEVNPMTGDPLRGVHHYELIENIMAICKRHTPDVLVKEIFAAQSQDRLTPGVVVAPVMIEKYGQGSPESHCLRRVFTTIHVNSNTDEETDTGIAIAYHQDGIQVGFGPNVKICHNQCILSADRFISTYGQNKIQDFSQLYQIIDDWMHNLQSIREEDLNMLTRMKEIPVDYRDAAELIGQLTLIRVGHDSNIARRNVYPLNQGQISMFTEKYLKAYKKRVEDEGDGRMSLYDIYNIATESYKPQAMAIPSIMPQNLAWATYIKESFAQLL